MEEIQEKSENIETPKGPAFGIRYVQFVLIFFAGFLMYSTRFGFSVALVAMTQNYSSNPDVPYYDWTNRSFILSTFFWGYVVTQIPAGILGTKYGCKMILLVSVFGNSLCMVAIPTVASYFGSEGVMACRIIQGLAQGFIIPSTHAVLGKWAVPNERSRVYGFIVTGSFLGSALGLSTTGMVCASWAGWPLTFYLVPSTGFIWVILYYFYGADSPFLHKTITNSELQYIQSTLKSQDTSNVSMPYREIFTSVPVWAVFVMALCSGWGFSIFTTELPIYMDKVMQFDIDSNGLVSALPSISNLLSINIVTITSDYLVKNNYLSVGTTRKLMSSLGSIGCAVSLLILIYIPDDSRTLCVLIIVIATVFRSINSGGYSINHVDLAPDYAPTLMGLVNTSAEIFSFITPMAIQYIVYDEGDRELWKIVFIIAICLYVFSSFFYIAFAAGEVQPWNYSSNKPRKTTKF